MIERDASGDGKIEAVDLAALGDENWSSKLSKIGREASGFIAKDK